MPSAEAVSVPARTRRTCIGCRRVAEPAEFVRIARRPDGSIGVGRAEPGRGAWLCRDVSCFEMAVRRRAFGRALRVEIGAVELASLRERLFQE